MAQEGSERGKPANFDRRTGEVHGSGSGAGGEGNSNEDYDFDFMAGSGAEPEAESGTGQGHPLPRSDEARHDEIPEHLERDKGRGDDSEARVQPAADPVTPDGETYRDDGAAAADDAEIGRG